jgi:hypothetical protein
MYKGFSMFLEPEPSDDTVDLCRLYNDDGTAFTFRWKKEHAIEELVFKYVDKCETSEKIPKDPSESICLFWVTGVDKLLHLSRRQILWNANSRYCKRSRTEVIRSVVGCTDCS